MTASGRFLPSDFCYPLLGRQGRHELEAHFQPRGQIVVRLKALGRHVYKTLQRLSGEVHLAGMRLLQGFAIAFGSDAHHECVVHHAARHVAIDHERDAAKHLFLADIRHGFIGLPQSLGYTLVVGHHSSRVMSVPIC